MTRPKSSLMDKFMAAKNPTIDHKNGMLTTYQGIRVTENKSTPKVKMVVGQGTPKVGDLGKAWPTK